MQTDAPALPRNRLRAIHAELIDRARTSAVNELAWQLLEAAHVVGQQHIGLHTLTHLHMLKLALRQRDVSEAAGQVLRLALVPLGHLSGRLPLGNPGRATVSAFASLPVRPELQALIDQARRSVSG